MGTVFSFLGLILPVNTIRLSRKKKWLLENGKRISSEFQKIETNTSFKVNGRHPYIIVSQWHDVETQTIHIFESENIWYNPEKFVNNKTIDVLVDSKNYKRYYMDINFLPKTEL